MEDGHKRKKIGFVVLIFALIVGFAVVRNPGPLDFVNIAFGGSTVSSTVTVGASAPTVTAVNINGTNSTITLTANTTTNVNVEATISDNNGCSSITGGT